MRKLTQRQLEVLQAIGEFWAEHHYSPSIRDLQKALQIGSTNGVTDHLYALERKGMLTRAPGRSRSIVLTTKGSRELSEVGG